MRLFASISFMSMTWRFLRAAKVGDYATGQHLDDNPLVSLTQMPMGGIWQVGGACWGLLGLLELVC